MDTTAIIRSASVADAPQLGALHVAAWQAAYRGTMPDAYLDSLDRSSRADQWGAILSSDGGDTQVVVAEIDSGVAGFVMFGPTRDAGASDRAGEVWAINVDPPSWRCGIGRTLLDQAVTLLRADGFSTATLWVVDGNERARRFYESAGWRADGATKVDESRGFAIVEVRYRRPLD